MTYEVLTVRTAEYEDGSMYPVLGDASCHIELEELDGPAIDRLSATVLAVYTPTDSGALKRQVMVRKIRAEVFITDARVAVACEKYEKGGGWIGFGGGGLMTAAVLNAASKARAAMRRRGKMLVGHVRYPWLAKVGFRNKEGWLGSEQVRLVLSESTSGLKRTLMLDLTLPSNVSAAATALAIAQRAARFRLAHDPDFKEDEREKFLALAEVEPIIGSGSGFTFYEMPTSFQANPQTAYPEGLTPRRDEGPPAAVAAKPETKPGKKATVRPVKRPAAKTPRPAALKFCGQCGAAWRANAQFCGDCGASAGAASSMTS